MRLLKDPERHKAMERWLAGRLVADIKASLEAANIKDDLVRELTKELALGVAAKWEFVAPNTVDIDGERTAPFLVFGIDNDDEDVVVRNYDDMGSFLTREIEAALILAFRA